jgi:hypothetical protein
MKNRIGNKKQIFLNFFDVFKENDIYIIADNISEDTYNFLLKYIDNNKIERTNLYNAKSFMYSLNYSLKNFNDDDIIYFAEDDYIYKKNADKIIEEGLSLGDYSSGYDHPDKYMNEGGNPFVKEGGELTRVLLSKNSHWKITNSCCMTFATKLKTIKYDYNIFKKNCINKQIPDDFQIFLDLYKYHNRKLVSSIPGVSTHAEILWLSPFTNWEKILEKYNHF